MQPEKPMLFSGPMIRANLEDRKTQTRRGAKGVIGDGTRENPIRMDLMKCPYGQVGDEIWVRETFQGYRQVNVEYDEWEEMQSPKDRHEQPYQPVYKADNKNFPEKWFPAIHMPREYSRIQLRITGIRLERLHDISEADARAEGAMWVDGGEEAGGWNHTGEDVTTFRTAKESFRHLWDQINGKTPFCWANNPWVWVIEFERIKP